MKMADTERRVILDLAVESFFRTQADRDALAAIIEPLGSEWSLVVEMLRRPRVALNRTTPIAWASSREPVRA